jgi:hypothetical protein
VALIAQAWVWTSWVAHRGAGQTVYDRGPDVLILVIVSILGKVIESGHAVHRGHGRWRTPFSIARNAGQHGAQPGDRLAPDRHVEVLVVA